MAASREPEQIYEETRKEGRRRLSRPVVELAATALVGGFDVAFGVAAYALAASAVGGSRGRLAGAIAFGIGFVFIVVGKSELFTENFLIPIAGLNKRDRGSWFKLGELWAVALVLNIVGGLLIVVVMTSHGVLRNGSAQPLPHLPARTYRSPSTTRRRTASTSANVRSAVAASSTPGVFVTETPRARQASTSIRS